MDKFLLLASGVLGFVCATIIIVAVAFRWLKKAENPGSVIILWIVTAAVVSFWLYLGLHVDQYGAMAPGIAAASGLFLSVFWAPHIAAAISKPLASLFEGADPDGELRPLYSMTESRRKRGQYPQALAEVHKQLERFPNDYQGWMLAAEIHAEDLHDLPAALATIEHVLSLELLASKNISYALGRVADWQLKFRHDPEAAREALQRVIDLLPNTEEARMAMQRIAHLATPAELLEHESPRVIALKHYEEKIGLEGRHVEAPKDDTFEDHAHRYLERLREFPEDNETRELLARCYGDEYQRLDLATLELEQLIAAPNQKRQHVAQWLNLLADYQIRLAGDVNLARKTLQRIIDQFPDSAASSNAQVKMSQLNLQLNQRTPQRTVKMGNYEQNVGLRKMNSSGKTTES